MEALRTTTGGQLQRSSPRSHLLLIVLSLVAVFPIYWMILTSFRADGELYSASLLPGQVTLDHYARAWNAIPMGRMLLNTVVMAASQTLLQLMTSVLAAYGFSRWNFRGKSILYALFALTWLVPFQATMIPNYVTLTQLGWRNSLAGLIIPHASSAFAILLLFQSFKSFPLELIDAARIDGATNWGVLWKVIFPNLRASIASLGVLLFISAWNDYFWPLLVTSHLENSTIQIGLQMFLSTDGNLWGPLMAAATTASLPILVVYVLLQRQIIDSFVKSGLR
ncbi:MAG: carbohydrate ABC transporter permease [Anaerolineae bacterium]|nr:carbohydrate ABC transporter permease [Anaerolineae bacterium]